MCLTRPRREEISVDRWPLLGGQGLLNKMHEMQAFIASMLIDSVDFIVLSRWGHTIYTEVHHSAKKNVPNPHPA